MYRILIVIILMVPTFSHAINYLGFGGGNYVYAEQGNLYFNIDPYAFDNRSWTYDKTTGFSAEIKVNMDLKTKYTSDDWLEQVVANKKSDGIMYANYIKQPFNYQNRGQYQHTWFWLARLAPSVGGFIGRTVAWNKFKSWTTGSAVVYGVGKFFCDGLLIEGISCTSEGFKQTVEYMYVSKVVNPATQQVVTTNTIYATRDEYVSHEKLIAVVQSKLKPVNPNGSTLEYCNVNVNVNCYYKRPAPQTGYDGYSFSWATMSKPLTEERLMEDRDLLKYFDEVCAKFPSECINEPTQGKNIKDVQLTGGVVGSPVNVIGPPYTNPITGTSQQDQVIIGGSSSGIGVNSATNDSWEYSPTLGQSGTLNPTQVTSIPRPDLTNTDTAPVAKPNEQTGTKPQVVVPPVTVPEFTDLNDMIDFCKANPKAMSCIETGTGEEAESIFDKIKIPEINLPTEFSKDNFLPATAACPAPTSIVTSHGTIMYSYDKHCEIAAFLRPIILIMATITGLFIIIRSKD
ncbi:hypothetical protein LVJ82_02195 [Vitreoscilla massiliensis]|uniref:Uncharacterized protein n=1 Tax=Vitreoscilla massiliensis TaxID=1689272 RepID=A0ABY4E2R4_9NEIS|nr:IgG-binding virulence factor TspB family protein [Vitreoscilla massiliensis]UOO89822.1 hypothetical protein LVJ82_02195 [Vitreoscilla massiliensis]